MARPRMGFFIDTAGLDLQLRMSTTAIIHIEIDLLCIPEWTPLSMQGVPRTV